MKRLLAFLLSISLLISLVAVPVSALWNTEFAIKVSSVTATAGDSNIAVEIALENNPGITGFSFCVDYDADNLVLVKSELNTPDGYPVATTLNDHQVNIAWASTGTYSSDGKIATLYFNVPSTAKAGNSEVKISCRDGYDSFYQYYDGTEHDIPVVTTNGDIQINSPETTSKLTACVGTATASMSDTDVIVPITISNNNELSGFSFCIDYDESRLELNSAEITIDGGYKVINYPEGYAVCLAWTDESNYSQNSSIALLHFAVKKNAKCGKAYVNILFRDGYDSFYKTVDKQEVDIECICISGYVDVMDHNFGEWQVVKEPTCTETGLKRRTCTDAGCNKTDEIVIPKIPHTYVVVVTPPTCTQRGYTTHTCNVCGASYVDSYVATVAHTPGEWEIKTEAGCTTKGEEVKRCTECGEILDSRSIPATGHTYGEWSVYKEPTFNTDGESRRYCDNCDSYEAARIPKLSESHTHDFTGREEIIIAPTCTESGSKKVFCSEPECGEYITVSIDATGHNYGDWVVTKEPTFNTDGEKQRVCTKCGDVEKQSIPMLSLSHTHSFSGREEITVQPTCTESGTKRIYCSEKACGEFITEVIQPLGHTEGEWEVLTPATCTQNGTEVKKCTVCGAILQSRVLEATGHTWDSGTVTKTATCIEDGEKTFTCTKCGETMKKAIPKSGHTESDWIITKNATCTQSGTKIKKCTVCGETIASDIIPATGHSFGEWVTTIYPTETTEGLMERTCSICGEKETKVIKATGVIPKISVSCESGNIGKQVSVSFSLSDNPGIASMQLSVNFDAEKLKLISVSDAGKLGMSVHSDNLNNPYTLSWVNDTATTDFTYSGTVATLTFQILDDAEIGITPITVSYNHGNYDIYNVMVEEVYFDTIAGSVNISNVLIGDVNSDGVVNGMDRMILTRYLAKWTEYPESCIDKIAADVNCDGVVNGLDRMILTRYLAKWSAYTELPYVQ